MTDDQLIKKRAGLDDIEVTDALGDVDAERFIALVMSEPFDYTKWQPKI